MPAARTILGRVRSNQGGIIQETDGGDMKEGGGEEIEPQEEFQEATVEETCGK